MEVLGVWSAVNLLCQGELGHEPYLRNLLRQAHKQRRAGTINCAPTGIFGEHGATNCANTIFTRRVCLQKIEAHPGVSASQYLQPLNSFADKLHSLFAESL